MASETTPLATQQQLATGNGVADSNSAIGRTHPAVGNLTVNRLPFHLSAYLGAAVIYTALYATIGRARSADDQSRYEFILLLCLWDLHFAKRCLEVLFVHRYGQPKVPVFESFGEQIVYLGFAAGCGYCVHANLSVPWRFGTPSTPVVALFSCVFLLGVVGNGICHWILARNDRKKGYPDVFLFKLVTCPHYMCEVITWTAWLIITQTFASAVFLLSTIITLTIFSRERWQQHRQFYDGKEGRPLYPPNRKALVPFIL